MSNKETLILVPAYNEVENLENVAVACAPQDHLLIVASGHDPPCVDGHGVDLQRSCVG